MRKLMQASISFVAGLAVAMAVSLFSYFAFWPSRLRVLASTDLLGVALLGALWASALGLLVLFFSTLRRPLAPSASALIVGSTLFGETLWHMVHPWQYYGQFPAWMLRRDFLQFLPFALAAGLVFGPVARRMGPNNSSKPMPLRGAA